MLIQMLEAIDCVQDFLMSFLTAVYFIHLAQHGVSRKTIANYFKRAKFFEKENEFDSNDELVIFK